MTGKSKSASKGRAGRVKFIYVYALVDKKKFSRSNDIINDSLYVGKGTGSRMAQHMREVKKRLASELGSEGGVNKAKIEKLLRLVQEGREIQAIRISAGYTSDADAFRAEALAISIINSGRKEPLLNAVNGHHAQRISDMQEHFLYTQADDVRLPARPSKFAILVKTTNEESGDSSWRSLKKPFLFQGQEIPRIVICSHANEMKARRPWNPLSPWTASEAHKRAYRFWSIQTSTVVQWLNGAQDRPTWLFAGVPDGRDTVVRYVWRIDWSGTWEFYPYEAGGTKGQWGIPVTNPETLESHDLLGKRLVERRKGKDVQVLNGYNKGVRVIGI